MRCLCQCTKISCRLLHRLQKRTPGDLGAEEDLMANDSTSFYFVLVGFSGLKEKFYPVLAALMFSNYSFSLCANTILIMIVLLKEHLHQPMYIIIANLAMSDLLFDTTTLPKVISKYWMGAESISLSTCFLQMTIVHTLNALDSLTLLLMAFDRYVAICKPLRYHAIINNRVSIFLCLAALFAAASVGIYVMTLAVFLPYCGPIRINNLHCTVSRVAILSCMDSSANRRNAFYISLIIHMGPFSLIVMSYILVIINIRTTTRLETWQKALNTCITHWTIIIIFYIPRIVDYAYQCLVIPDPEVTVLMNSVYTYVPHISSPIIFCLQNKEIKRTLENILPEDGEEDTILDMLAQAKAGGSIEDMEGLCIAACRRRFLPKPPPSPRCVEHEGRSHSFVGKASRKEHGAGRRGEVPIPEKEPRLQQVSREGKLPCRIPEKRGQRPQLQTRGHSPAPQ
ncbi:olfactory receptor 2T5-like [Ranitomeya imitator]|uniref:olfactory receptor 2T5-like n=1 Tax=Ranitomeya imitator TaxID=111125 RepID=UPI0037E92268